MSTPPDGLRVQRLEANDLDLARATFACMAEVFEEDHTRLSDDYLTRLLERPEFWALAVLVDESVVGGLTAHTLQMTTTERAEVFLYDIAIDPQQQRNGHGRRLVDDLLRRMREQGIDTMFVPADDDDTHALDF